jgi:Flp pilus assembly CpaF family ATPase
MQFSSAYFPSSANVWLAQKVIAMVRTSLSLRDPSQPRYAKFIHGQRDVMAGGALKAMPSFLHSLKGAGILLAGPAGTGKTAFIQRLHACIGEEHTIIRLGGSRALQARCHSSMTC